jgi:hypothetical protein
MWCVSSDEPMINGKHYCEIKIIQMSGLMTIGVLKSDPEEPDPEEVGEENWWALPFNGATKIAQGDRVGIMLDLDGQLLQFYVNGVQTQYKLKKQITGPVVFSVMMSHNGDSIALVPSSIDRCHVCHKKNPEYMSTEDVLAAPPVQVCGLKCEARYLKSRGVMACKGETANETPKPGPKTKARRLTNLSPAEADNRILTARAASKRQRLNYQSPKTDSKCDNDEGRWKKVLVEDRKQKLADDRKGRGKPFCGFPGQFPLEGKS